MYRMPSDYPLIASGQSQKTSASHEDDGVHLVPLHHRVNLTSLSSLRSSQFKSSGVQQKAFTSTGAFNHRGNANRRVSAHHRLHSYHRLTPSSSFTSSTDLTPSTSFTSSTDLTPSSAFTSSTDLTHRVHSHHRLT